MGLQGAPGVKVCIINHKSSHFSIFVNHTLLLHDNISILILLGEAFLCPWGNDFGFSVSIIFCM